MTQLWGNSWFGAKVKCFRPARLHNSMLNWNSTNWVCIATLYKWHTKTDSGKDRVNLHNLHVFDRRVFAKGILISLPLPFCISYLPFLLVVSCWGNTKFLACPNTKASDWIPALQAVFPAIQIRRQEVMSGHSLIESVACVSATTHTSTCPCDIKRLGYHSIGLFSGRNRVGDRLLTNSLGNIQP